MGYGLNMIASALLIIWFVEYFGYEAGENIHILLLLAIIIILGKTFMRSAARDRT